ncbi:uncharacterized protein LOC114352628 isoform X3 [Ostrinia furnacalis]|nr:uncharacterized protein LOC114352628 isoform X2 [Ostrinia furnacalis]XP_028160092.1 uncharacterized protein LOC114352628 isoform X3 [Ostrinia furnacalis]
MFLNLSVEDRHKLVNDNNLCPNCLRPGHLIKDCFFGPCQQCKQKHNSLLHKDSLNCVNTSSHNASSTSQLKSTVLHSSLNQTQNTPLPVLTRPVLLSTALIEVLDDNNKRHTARALLDNGSQHCFVSETFCKRIKYTKFLQSTVRISGVGQSVSHSNKLCDLIIHSKLNDFSTSVQCFVLPRITSFLPPVSIDVETIRIPNNIELADPTYYLPSEVDLLIGADLFWEILNDNKIRLKSGPYLQDTKLGWLISGPIYTNKMRCKQNIQCNFTQTIDLQLRQFWELEDSGPRENIFTCDERKCEEIFKNTTKREIDGRFSVRIPLKESADLLGDSYSVAYKRFLSLERKLERMPQYKRMYADFIREYRDLGHMTKINEYSDPHYFLPHHGVFRESSTTTKLRVVFDASCATTSDKSLNDLQFIGPRLQNDIFSILLRFRQYYWVASADVEKMFRQTLIHEDQRNLQLILWRESSSDPIDVYRLNTVTYGTASAPYLSMRCLQQVAQECDDEKISRIIKEDFYVDDLITGCDDPAELINICEKISQILRQYCYPLRKWTFNCDVTSTNSSKELAIGEHTQTKTLGLGWHNKNDLLHFTSELGKNCDNTQLTKRKMLS